MDEKRYSAEEERDCLIVALGLLSGIGENQ
jgi:hypothetical protein